MRGEWLGAARQQLPNGHWLRVLSHESLEIERARRANERRLSARRPDAVNKRLSAARPLAAVAVLMANEARRQLGVECSLRGSTASEDLPLVGKLLLLLAVF
jgi:hypothetical protein